MGSLKKMKKKGKSNPSPLDSKLTEAWNRGFYIGTKKQREVDIKFLLEFLENLEGLPGIGVKTARKIRVLFENSFGEKGEKVD